MVIGIEATKAYEAEKTGVGWYTHYLISELVGLARDDIQLRLYVNPALINLKPQIQNFKLQAIDKRGNAVTVKQLSWLPRKFWTQARLSLEMVINPPDVLFIPAHLPPLVHPKKLVVTIHDLAFKQYPEVYSKRELLLQEWGIRRILKHAWRIIVPSQFTKDEIHRYYPRHTKDNIFVVPHGVGKIRNPKSEIRNGTSNVRTIVYIGRLENKKNIVNLIKAFNLLRVSNFEFRISSLILIGPPGYGYAAIKQEIADSPYKNDIHELGWVDRETMADYLQNATLFVFPSLYEGFGMPLLEAFAAGTPVVCSDIPVFHEVGGDIPLYFDPHDPQDIAKKIAALLHDADTAKGKREEGFRHASAFTWEGSAKQTLTVCSG